MAPCGAFAAFQILKKVDIRSINLGSLLAGKWKTYDLILSMLGIMLQIEEL